MKTKILYISALLTLCLLSCSLDEEVFSNFSQEGFFASETEVELAVNGNYNAIAVLYEGATWFGMANLPTNQLSQPNQDVDRIELDEYNAASENLIVERIWQRSYTLIARSNYIIDNLSGNTEIAERITTRAVAEASFLRALGYFNLVRIFGEVPLIVTGDEVVNQIAKNTVPEIYSQIVTDLEFAEDNLPLESEISLKGRASQGAAKALLAKVHLYQQNFAAALEKAEEVIESQEYSLFEDFEALWLLSNENGTEHIFSAQFNQGAQSNGLDQFLASGNSSFRNGGFESFLIHQEFYDNFPDSDYRKDVTFVEEGILQVFKFLDRTGGSTNGAQGMNMPVLRYADVLLMAAEAENEVNGPAGAYQYINQVRGRARNRDGVPGTEPADLAGLTQQQFRDAVYRERELEMAFEGEAWFDLVRQGRFVEVLGPLGAASENETMPLPQRDLDINDLLNQ